MAYNHRIPPKVFISYSHTDSEWLDRLRVHLRPLEREYGVDFWDDTRITSGSKWKKEIENALESSRIAVLLVSADFLASEFVATDELPPLLSAAGQKGTIILPLILSPSRFLRTKSLSQFQSINDPRKPLISLTRGEQEEVLDRVAQRIEILLADVPEPAANSLDRQTPEHDYSTARTIPESEDRVPHQPTPPYIDSSDDLYIRMRAMVIDELGLDESDVTSNSRFMDDLGADSLDLVELVMRAEEQFNIEIPDDDAVNISTVRDAYLYLKTKV